jgi:CheY-like chemotaxis protein
MKILWLEDEENLQTIIVALLKKSDGVFDIEFVVDGDAAIKRYREPGAYDLVMTDYLHSGLNGLEFSRAIRKGNPLQAIAVALSPSFDGVLH